MSNNMYDILKTAYSRVFVLEGRASPTTQPVYCSQLKMTGLTQNYGDVTKIEIPDPLNYGKFVEIDSIVGAAERASTTLVGRYASNLRSMLMRIAMQGCESDVQLHIGKCTDPASFNTFSKAIILERVRISSWSTEDLGALASDESAKVDETANITAAKVYEALPMSYASRANDIITNELMDVKVIDTVSCGDCDISSDGCYQIFAIGKAAGGSPSTPADIVYSIDKGATWKAEDIDAMNVASDGSSVFPCSDFIVAISDDEAALFYAAKSYFTDQVDPVWTKVTTGFVQKPFYGCAAGRKAFIVGDWGYVYLCEEPGSGVSVLDAGAATISSLKCVNAIDEYNAIACGNDGVVLYTFNQTSWATPSTNPVGVGIHLTGCWMKSTTEWWVAASNGYLYYTKNSGETWARKTMPGTAPSAMKSVVFASDSIGYACGTVSSKGRIFRTFDGGYSWCVVPETGASFVNATLLNVVAACPFDVNFVAAVGQNYPTNTDGILIIGETSG